jgi:hypothetical protein
VLDPRIPDGLTSVRRWSFDDVIHAHEFLDELDAADARAEARAPDGGGR